MMNQVQLRLSDDTVAKLKLSASNLGLTPSELITHIFNPSASNLSLIKKIRIAVKKGVLPKAFTTYDVNQWIKKFNITKQDGTSYSPKSIDSLLSNSCIDNSESSNKNSKVLTRKLNQENKYEYSFI